MKKILLSFLVLVVILSLCACNMNKAEEITIDNDNWDDYFEIYNVENWNKDAFGDVEALQLGFSIKLKDEYIGRVKIFKNENDCDRINFKFQYTPAIYNAVFYWDECRYNQGGSPVYTKDTVTVSGTHVIKNDNKTDFPEFFNSYISRNVSEKRLQICKYDNLKVNKVSGKIHLYK